MPKESHFNHWLFWLTVFAVAMAQFALCYEALVCRGYPPLTEMGIYKKWASPFIIWLPAIFGTRVMRFWGLVASSFITACLFQMISINGMMTPSIGHLTGVSGIIKSHYPEILIVSLFCLPFVFAILYFPERVFGDLSRALFALPTRNLSFAETWDEAWRVSRLIDDADARMAKRCTRSRRQRVF